MSQHRVPAQVQSAIQNVRDVMEARPDSGWNVSIRNHKVVFTAPDGVNLTIGLMPNSESLKKFLREATRYNLIDGPIRTPAEAEALLKQAEEEAKKQAEEQNRKRQAFEAEQARKREEAEEAARKASLATAKGLVSQEASVAVPTQTTTVQGGSPFPAFDKSLLGTTDYSKLRLSDGRYYCIECLGDGVEFTARAPQGLATHRGFRHQMYQGAEHQTNTQETSRVILPGDIHDSIELLRSVIAENLGPAGDPEKLAELERALQQAKEDLAKADSDYQALKESSDASLKAAKSRIHELSEELSGKDGKHAAEQEALMKSFRVLLKNVQDAVNNLSPVKAVGKVDELVTPYLEG